MYITVARARGDPHITTIDGRRYTFNGLGEYVLLRTNNFEFQGRTTLAANSNATIFSAFALREDDDYIEVTNLVCSYYNKSFLLDFKTIRTVLACMIAYLATYV